MPFIGTQMLWCPMQIGSDLNTKEKLNANLPPASWMNESIMVPKTRYKHSVINKDNGNMNTSNLWAETKEDEEHETNTHSQRQLASPGRDSLMT